MALPERIELRSIDHACTVYCKQRVHADVGYSDAEMSLADLDIIFAWSVPGYVSVDGAPEAPIPLDILAEFNGRACYAYLMRWIV